MRDHKQLIIWQKAHELYLLIRQQVATAIPKTERYELTSQLLRAALSVPLNIAEGAGRFSNKEFRHFISIALGSLHETEYCCFVALELNYISKETYTTASTLLSHEKAMLLNYLKYLRRTEITKPKK